tara:strand:+ start:386 stop:883 length:498 start_codon:yes stop_codon:yes gene_type:complete
MKCGQIISSQVNTFKIIKFFTDFKGIKMNLTFSIIKPDATKRNITGSINKIIEDNGLRIIAQKRIILSKGKAQEFYLIHKDKPFFNDLIEYMTSEPVIVQVLKAENAVVKYREVMGSTNPKDAISGSIRNLYGLNIQENSVHGSDSNENAKKEIEYFFDDIELVG